MLEEAKWTKLTHDNVDELYNYSERRVIVCKPHGDFRLPPMMLQHVSMTLSTMVKNYDDFYFYILPEIS